MHNLFFLSFLIIFYTASTLDHISKPSSLFSSIQNSPSSRKLSPPIIKSLSQQSSSYTNLYSSINFYEYKFDPSLSCEYKLETSIREQDSVWIMSQPDTQFLMEVSIDIQNDPETQLVGKEQGDIFLYVLDGQGVVIHAIHVIRDMLVKLDLAGDGQGRLYEIRTVLHTQKSDQSEKNVKLQSIVSIRISRRPSSSKRERINKYAEQLEEKIRKLFDTGTLIFLDGLEDWGIIEISGARYLQSREEWRQRSIYQFVAFVVVAMIELVFLWRLTKKANNVI